MVVYTFNPITCEAQAADLWIQDQPSLQREFQDGQRYTRKPQKKINKIK